MQGQLGRTNRTRSNFVRCGAWSNFVWHLLACFEHKWQNTHPQAMIKFGERNVRLQQCSQSFATVNTVSYSLMSGIEGIILDCLSTSSAVGCNIIWTSGPYSDNLQMFPFFFKLYCIVFQDFSTINQTCNPEESNCFLPCTDKSTTMKACVD